MRCRCRMATGRTPCDGEVSVLSGIPYLLFPNDTSRPVSPITNIRDNHIRFWIHISFVVVGFILAVVTFFAQVFKPAPYGKLAEGSERFRVPTRISFILSEIIPGIVLFTLTYFLSGQNFSGGVNVVFYCLFTVHYVHRGLIHPFVARYSRPRVPLWIPLSTTLANILYHYINAEFIGSAFYCNGYHYDPRFLIGIVLFVVGFVINRAADTQLACLRRSRKDQFYAIPKGPLFYLVSCPNYFGEGLQWLGWTIATWSLAGLVWWLFTEATFIPRARHNHQWYKEQFPHYPHHRKALIPFIY